MWIDGEPPRDGKLYVLKVYHPSSNTTRAAVCTRFGNAWRYQGDDLFFKPMPDAWEILGYALVESLA